MRLKQLKILFCLMTSSGFVFLCNATIEAPQKFFGTKKTYTFSAEPIDVVFVCHPKDLKMLELSIVGIKKNATNIRRVVVVSAYKLTDSAEWFDEALFPFTQLDLSLEIFKGDRERATLYITEKDSRLGWIYQQILKLYAPFIIPDISSNVLIVDADTVFLRNVAFMDNEGNPLFNPGSEYNPEYFNHGQRLLPGFTKIYPHYSGISHHMLFQRPVLEDLFTTIQAVHGIEPWRAVCRFIDITAWSPVSEYEIYFNFIFARTEQAIIRHLVRQDMKFEQKRFDECTRGGFDYVSCHSWL